MPAPAGTPPVRVEGDADLSRTYVLVIVVEVVVVAALYVLGRAFS